jgi:hypothetical protein
MATRASRLADDASQLALIFRRKTPGYREVVVHALLEGERDPIERVFVTAKICDMLDPGQRADFIALLRTEGDL